MTQDFFRAKSRLLRLPLIVASVLMTAAIAGAQTAYDRIANTNPKNVFVLYSGPESEYAAKDIATNLASRKKWKISTDVKEKVVQLSYSQFDQAMTSTAKDAKKFQDAFSDVSSTIIVVDCKKDAGPLPETVYAEIRRMGGPVALRRTPDQRITLDDSKPVIWSNFRAFSANNEGVENNELVFVLAADSLEGVEQLKAKLAETTSDDRPPIYPENPFTSLNAYPIAVLPIRAGAIDPKLAPASGYIAERLASLVTSLGMRQVERGEAADAVLREATGQEKGEYTAQDGQAFGERLGADVVATGVIRKLELNRGGNVIDRHWDATIEISIKLITVSTGEVIFDSGAIRGTSRAKSGNIFRDAVEGQDAPPTNTNLWGGLESDAVRAAERALKNGLFIFEMGLRAKCDDVAARLGTAYKDRGAPIDWGDLKRRYSGVKFAVRIPETIIQRPVPDPAVETGIMRALTQAGADVRDPSTVKSAVDDAMLDRMLRGQIAPADRRRIQKALGADVLITGEAFAKILGPASGGLNSAQARSEIKVISLKTGRILAADSREATQQAASEEVAGKRALEKTARILAQSSAFWDSLANNLDQDRREWATLEAQPDPTDSANKAPLAPPKLGGIRFMVAFAPASGVSSAFIDQLESSAISKLMDAEADVLDSSRAEDLKKLGVFDAVASGSSSNYMELKAACPADVLVIGKVVSTAGARGSAIQVSWKAIWMSDAKMIGAGSEIGFLESADPAEMLLASKDVAGKVVDQVARTVSKNKPQNRMFTIEIQRLTSATQAAQVKKAVLGAFPSATTTFRAGTLRVTFKPGALDNETIALRLEQKMSIAKLKIKVISSDVSSIRATVTAGGSSSGGSGGAAKGGALSARSLAIVKKLSAKGLKFAVCFADGMGGGVGRASSQELAISALHSAGLVIMDARLLQSRLGEDAFAGFVSGTLSPASLDKMREKFQGYTLIGGVIQPDPAGDEMVYGRGAAVDLRSGKIAAIVSSTRLDPMPGGMPAELANKELGKRIAKVLDAILEGLAKTYAIA